MLRAVNQPYPTLSTLSWPHSRAVWRSAQDELLAQLEDVYDSEEDNDEWAHNRDTPHHSEDPPEREGPSSQSANIHERIIIPSTADRPKSEQTGTG